MPADLAGGQIDQREVVVLLQRDDRDVVLVDRDVLGFRVGAVQRGQAGQRHIAAGPGRRGADQIDDRQATGRQLRDRAAVDALVALVLDHDRGVAPVLADRHRIRLPAQVQLGHLGARGDVHHHQLAGRCGERRRGVHRHQCMRPDHGHRGWLAVQLQRTQPDRRRRVGDVDEADLLAQAAGVDQRHAIGAGRDDLGVDGGRRLAGRADLRADREGGDPIEVHARVRHRGRDDGRRRRRIVTAAATGTQSDHHHQRGQGDRCLAQAGKRHVQLLSEAAMLARTGDSAVNSR